MKESDWKPTGSGGDLVPVHGGLAEPVDRVVPLAERARLLREAEKLPPLRVTRADLSTRLPDRRRRALPARRSDGRGRPGTACSTSSASWCRGERYAWTIPLSLPVDRRGGARSSRAAARRRSATRTGEVVGDPRRARRLRLGQAEVRAERLPHRAHRSSRAADMVSRATRARSWSADDLRVLPQPKNPEFGEYVLSPREVRALLRERKWERASPSRRATRCTARTSTRWSTAPSA